MRYPGGYLLMYFVVYFGLAFVWRSVAVYLATGVQPIHLPATDDAQGYVGQMFKGLLVLCGLYLLAQSMDVNAGWMPAPMGWLDNIWLQLLGWAMLAGSGSLLICAQSQMGLSWRIGLDADTPGPLVMHGFFAHSRNPIFLSMRLNLLGLMCLLPNLFTLLLLVSGELLIQIQVRLEEPHLSQLYGETYEVYRAHVPRWW